ncbi:MAG: DUF1996 domain-containing protein [Acidimicrobiia bacterium]|nr:DUF1996 domain-containing protein [Acidimicrobiia bacterium]
MNFRTRLLTIASLALPTLLTAMAVLAVSTAGSRPAEAGTATATVDVRVSAGNDDAEESSSGRMSRSSSDLELVDDRGAQLVGMRFAELDVPPGAVVTAAHIQFTVDEKDDDVAELLLWGQAADDPAGFGRSSADVSSRPRVAAAVYWKPTPWVDPGDAGAAQRTPDLTSIVQKIVDRPGWEAGNAVVMIVTGRGTRTAESYNGDADAAPLLHVEYETTATGNLSPVVSIDQPTNDATVVDGDPVTFVGTAIDPEDGDLTSSVVWTSNLDGHVGTGGSVTADLSVGTHTVTAAVSDTVGARGEATVGVTVTAPVPDPDPLPDPSDPTRFILQCGPVSHSGQFDPIVFPGQAPAGHQHEFYGSTLTDPNSTPESLIGTPTECGDSADSSAYWHPTVYFDGVRAPAPHLAAYYTQRSLKKPLDGIQAWPAGLRIIAGNGAAQGPQDTSIVYWGCDGTDMSKLDYVPTCSPTSKGLEAHIRFPDCWDGVNLDAPDHKSHMAYSERIDGVYVCDAAHPVSLPYLVLKLRWDDQYPVGDTVTLASGSINTLHADFMNGWDQDRLDFLFDHCIRTGVDCDIVTTNDPPTPTTGNSLTRQVSTSDDDAEEEVSSGSVSTGSSDLELGHEGSAQEVGLRFTGLDIPAGATIVDAHLQFTVDETGSAPAVLEIRGQAVDNASAFVAADQNISNRETTVAAVSWEPEPWTIVGASGAQQRTPNLATVVQELVGRFGWRSGNSMVFIVTGDGQRVAESHDGKATAAPVLHIEWSAPQG